MTVDVAQSELQCGACGGQRAFRPAHGGLECLSCGDVARLETPDDHQAAAEFDLKSGADEPVAFETHVHHCETCGGDVIFTGPVLSERCAYCDGPVVMRRSDEAFATKALIPFAVEEADAQRKALDWVGRRFAAPGDLSGVVAEGRVAGVYAPFWTFDSEEAVDYWAKYSVKRGKRRVTRETSGALNISFDDLLVPASPHVTPLIRDGILHEFQPDRLRPYRPGYLAGFAAEQHHQTVDQGLEAGREDRDLLIRNRIKKHINKSGVRDIRFSTTSTGVRYRRILLPVWILHYNYEGRPMKVVVCGIHGRTFGERPFSLPKLVGWSAVFSAAAILAGLVWGVMAAP